MTDTIYSEEKAASYKLLARFRQANDAINSLRQNELKKYGLTLEQAGALHIIHYFGDQATAFELSKVLSRKPPAMTILLRRLEKKGLIKKTVDKKRRNTVRLSLTAKGHKLYHEAQELPVLINVFGQLSVKEMEKLATIMEHLRDSAWKHMNVDIDSYSRLTAKFDLKQATDRPI